MTFLPVVERELREAARKRGSFRVRTSVALLTSALAALMLLLSYGTSPGRLGKGIFLTLSVFAFAYCFLEGTRNASDCVSEEKREGTLGLLFLTDLRGYDVVLGKLAAVSIRSFQGLFAFVPILAVALIIGGVTGGEFWRMSAVLVNTLFFSLCVGIWISCLSRESHKSVVGTLAVLALLTALPFLVLRLIGGSLQPVRLLFGSLSPAYAAYVSRDISYAINPEDFWVSLIVTHMAGWGLLVASSVAISRVWQERPFFAGLWKKQALLTKRFLVTKLDAGARLRMLDQNPFFWLAARNEAERSFVWLLLGAISALWILIMLYHRADLTVVSGFGAGVLFLELAILKIWMVLQSCRHLSEAARTQALELFLVAPIRPDEIVNGHWLAMKYLFAGPVSLVIACHVIAIFLDGGSQSNPWALLPNAGATLFAVVTLVVDLFALWWVGTWMGLSRKNTTEAIAMTVVIGMIVPLLVFCLPNIVIDLALINWARTRLEREFRKMVGERFGLSEFGVRKRIAVKAAPTASPPVIAH